MSRHGINATTKQMRLEATSDYLPSAKRGLTKEERKIFDEVVRRKNPGFYREDDSDLLCRYSKNLILGKYYDTKLAEALAAEDLKAADFYAKRAEKNTSLLMSLCRLLKIGPGTRETSKSITKHTDTGIPVKPSIRAGLMYSGAEARPALN